MSLKPTFRIKVKVTGNDQGVEISHFESKGSDDEQIFGFKVLYYVKHWKEMGRPDPWTVEFQKAADGSPVPGPERKASSDVAPLNPETLNGGARLRRIDDRVFKAHPELLDGIESGPSEGPTWTVLSFPFQHTGVLLRIAAENPDFLSTLHEELVGARDQWRLIQLSEEKTRALAEAILQVEGLIAQASLPDQS